MLNGQRLISSLAGYLGAMPNPSSIVDRVVLYGREREGLNSKVVRDAIRHTLYDENLYLVSDGKTRILRPAEIESARLTSLKI